MADLFSSRRRNYMLSSHRKDRLIEWMKEMLNHSFVLDASRTYADTFSYFEELIAEYQKDRESSRLLRIVPSIGTFFSALPLREAFLRYDAKYCITARRHVTPSFNEIRHILNLAQVIALKDTLKLVTFDGDQTLYSDGGCYEDNKVLSGAVAGLLRAGVRIALVTAAGYGLDGSKYAHRIQVLLDMFVEVGLTEEEIGRFYVFGGECNYLLRCVLVNDKPDAPFVQLCPVQPEEWQAPELGGPRPTYWDAEEVTRILDIAENTMKDTRDQMQLRARILRKERAVGMFPGGDALVKEYPKGHGHLKLKREALDETVLRIMDALRVAEPKIQLPYCVFNGGRDAWVDIGHKGVGVEALQAYFGVAPATCLHLGDQFLVTGNDHAARNVSPCIWIISPRETEKILETLINVTGIKPINARKDRDSSGPLTRFDVWTGQTVNADDGSVVNE